VEYDVARLLHYTWHFGPQLGLTPDEIQACATNLVYSYYHGGAALPAGNPVAVLGVRSMLALLARTGNQDLGSVNHTANIDDFARAYVNKLQRIWALKDQIGQTMSGP